MSADLFAAPASSLARVALPLPVDELFDYAIPDALVGSVVPGVRVRVANGRRHLVGVVVERSEGEARGLRPIAEVLDREPVLLPGLLGVIREAAADLLCPIGLALATALPSGSAPRHRAGLLRSERGTRAVESGAATGELRALLAASEVASDEAELRRRCGDKLVDTAIRERLLARISIEHAASARRRTESWARIVEGLDPKRAETDLARAPRQLALLARIQAFETVRARDLREHAGDARALRELVHRGFVRLEERDAPRDVLGNAPARDLPPQLTADQDVAVRVLVAAVERREAATFLLHGVTGSGKTEVYLRAIAALRKEGRQALVLVPEITLTHQLVQRLRARFGDDLAILHSGLSAGERLEQWEQLRRGAARVAVGARSALFAPLSDLGLIVIDEEHDSAYKNGEGFRYHARDLALRRARAEGCPVILGSATPALETLYAAEQGEITRLVLPHRVAGRPLPAVSLVDLVRERASLPRGRKLILSNALQRGMREVHSDGGQTILFLNRRGFATQIACFSCGHVESCKHCDISLVYHAGTELLRCHYCDYQRAPSETCSACGEADGALLGLGTQRVEEAVREALPGARVARLDRDTASRRGATEAILDDLREHRVDVLVGTQMVAKGHDFPGVRLVGVIHADQALHFPDFRAAERCFSLLAQVAGRAGRGREPGRVLIQTYAPDHYALEAAQSHDYEGFFLRELEARRELGYPPFGRLAHIVVSAPELAQAEDAASRLAKHARALCDERCSALGPAPAPLARLRGRYRMQLMLKAPDREALRALAAALLPELQATTDPVRATLDLDPVDML
jgi:primosomal protein N' (replication factor Y)